MRKLPSLFLLQCHNNRVDPHSDQNTRQLQYQVNSFETDDPSTISTPSNSVNTLSSVSFRPYVEVTVTAVCSAKNKQINDEGISNYSQMQLKGSKVFPADGQRPTSPNSLNKTKSAWERAQEKFEQKAKEKTSTATTITVDESDFPADDCWKGDTILGIFRSKRFKEPMSEVLYQRYFFKLNLNNVSWLMILLAAACAILIGFHYMGGSRTVVKGIILGVIILVLALLEILTNCWVAFSQIHLNILCYVIIILCAGIVTLTTLDCNPRSATAGLWVTVFCIYSCYSLLPIRMRLAVATGLSLSVIHIILSITLNHSDWFLWKQVRYRWTFI